MTKTDAEDNRYEGIYKVFFDALAQNSCEAIVIAASELFGCPVLLTDENYKLICQFPAEKIGQDIWDTLYETGTLPDETIWAYQSAFLQKEQSVYEPFYADDGLVKDCPRIFGEIYTEDKKILGHTAVFMTERSLQDQDLQAVGIFIDALRIHMSQMNGEFRSSPDYLNDLLEAGVSAQRRLLARKVLAQRIEGNYSLMVIASDQNAAQRAYTTRAIQYLNDSFRNTVSTVSDGHIVTIFGEMDGLSYREKEKGFIRKVAGSLPRAFVNAGISDPFANLEDLHIYYRQAVTAVQLHKEQVTFHEDYAAQSFFVPALLAAPEQTYVHPVLRQMREYDKENETSYYETLRVCCMHMFDREAAAGELFIHRNTLLYRLNRIRELFALDLDDQNTLLHLLNSFQMLDIKE